jgi:hypothetical protein
MALHRLGSGSFWVPRPLGGNLMIGRGWYGGGIEAGDTQGEYIVRCLGTARRISREVDLDRIGSGCQQPLFKAAPPEWAIKKGTSSISLKDAEIG